MKNPRERTNESWDNKTTFILLVEKLLNDDIVSKNRSYFNECCSMGLSPRVSVELFLR